MNDSEKSSESRDKPIGWPWPLRRNKNYQERVGHLAEATAKGLLQTDQIVLKKKPGEECVTVTFQSEASPEDYARSIQDTFDRARREARIRALIDRINRMLAFFKVPKKWRIKQKEEYASA